MTNPGDRLECKRCGHAWNTRTDRKPVQCPRCKSTSWDSTPQLGEARAEYKARGSRLPETLYIGGEYRTLDEIRAIQRKTDWSKLREFGMWADRTDTDEVILGQIREGWSLPDFEDEHDYAVPD